MTWTEWQEHISFTNSFRDGQGPLSTKGKTWKRSHLPFCVEQNTRHQSPVPEEDSHHREDNKDPRCGSHQECKATLLPPTSLYQKWPRKTKRSHALSGTSFTQKEKRQNQISFVNGGRSPMVSRYLHEGTTWQLACMYPSHVTMEGALCLLCGVWTTRSCEHGQGHWPACLTRTKEQSLNLQQEEILPCKVISLAQVVWTLSLLERKCSRPKARSSVSEWKAKACVYETAFPNTGIMQTSLPTPICLSTWVLIAWVWRIEEERLEVRKPILAWAFVSLPEYGEQICLPVVWVVIFPPFFLKGWPQGLRVIIL